MSVTLMPRSAARNAAAYPPGPPPITAILTFVVSDMKRLSTTKGTKVHEETQAPHGFPSCNFVSFVVQDFDFHPCTESRKGCSNASEIQRRKRAASAPSINRWS